MMCRTLPAHTRIGSIPDFYWFFFTLDPFFDHYLSCTCPNGSCEAILDIYTSRPIQWYKEHLNVRTPTIKLWIFGSPEGLQIPTFGNVSFILTLALKWGCDKFHFDQLFLWKHQSLLEYKFDHYHGNENNQVWKIF
jgi:hypothetical protein